LNLKSSLDALMAVVKNNQDSALSKVLNALVIHLINALMVYAPKIKVSA